MKNFKIIFIFLILTSFSNIDVPEYYKNSWKLEKIDYPNKLPIKQFESVWFLTVDGKTGDFNNTSKEIIINGSWTKTDKNLVIKKNKEVTEYHIISWDSQQIILSDDGANYYFTK